MSWLFVSGGRSIGASASALVLPVNIQGLFPLGLTGLALNHTLENGQDSYCFVYLITIFKLHLIVYQLGPNKVDLKKQTNSFKKKAQDQMV